MSCLVVVMKCQGMLMVEELLQWLLKVEAQSGVMGVDLVVDLEMGQLEEEELCLGENDSDE